MSVAGAQVTRTSSVVSSEARSEQPTALNPAIRHELLAAIPSLRAFAISLTGDLTRADDLVQDTLVRALAHIDRFKCGTNLHAWLFIILRNAFYSERRKTRWMVGDPEGSYAAGLRQAPAQGAHLDFEDMKKALAKLRPHQREALLLIGAQGFSYDEAAQITGCSVGTIKSRVSRARERLALLLDHDNPEDLGADLLTKAVLGAT